MGILEALKEIKKLLQFSDNAEHVEAYSLAHKAIEEVERPEREKRLEERRKREQREDEEENTKSEALSTRVGEKLKAIEEAQDKRCYVKAGHRLGRIAHTKDRNGSYDPCKSCNVSVGQLHVPECVLERCPFCEGFVVNCESGVSICKCALELA